MVLGEHVLKNLISGTLGSVIFTCAVLRCLARSHWQQPMRSSPCHYLETPPGVLIIIHFRLQVRLGKWKAVLIIITFNKENFKCSQNASKDRVQHIVLFSMRVLIPKCPHSKISRSNSVMLTLNPGLQCRCNACKIINFTVKAGMDNGCVTIINLYQAITPVACIARVFHARVVPVCDACPNSVQNLSSPFPLASFHSYKTTKSARIMLRE